jgi:hypothetical protein
MIFLILIIALIMYFQQKVPLEHNNIFYNSSTGIPESNLKSSCNSLTDLSCKFYTNVDIKSKCKTLCANKFPKTIFNGNHYVDPGGIHTCECIPEKSIEQFTLDFTPIVSTDNVSTDNVSTDNLFSDRNYVEKNQESRLSNLIFGKI